MQKCIFLSLDSLELNHIIKLIDQLKIVACSEIFVSVIDKSYKYFQEIVLKISNIYKALQFCRIKLRDCHSRGKMNNSHRENLEIY